MVGGFSHRGHLVIAAWAGLVCAWIQDGFSGMSVALAVMVGRLGPAGTGDWSSYAGLLRHRGLQGAELLTQLLRAPVEQHSKRPGRK